MEDDAILETVTGGSTEYQSFLFRCPKCGREGRQTALSGVRTPMCLFCMVTMEMVDGTSQLQTF